MTAAPVSLRREVVSAPPPALTLRAYVSSNPALVLMVALTTFGMFAAAAIVSFAFSDDYSILWMAVSGEPSQQFGKSILDASQDGGRPFAGLLTQGFFQTAGTIDNLRWVRLFAVMAIVALALLLHWALVRSDVKKVPAALIAVFVCSMPAFQVFAAWTVIFCAPLAALFAGAASLLVVLAVEGQRNLVADRAVGATALLLAALLSYQPAAMFFWVFFAVALVGAREDPRRAVRLTRAHFAIGGTALALAYAVTKISVHLSGRGGRAALTGDVGGKVHWFIHTVLYQSLNLFDLTPTHALAGLVAVVAAGGMLLWLVSWASRPLLYVAVGLVLIPLCFLPNLVVAENSPTFRVQVALTSLVALYACLGVMGIWVTGRAWLEPRIGSDALLTVERLGVAVSIVVVGLSVFLAARDELTLLVEPQRTELRLLRSQVRALPPDASRIAFVQTGYNEGLTKLALVGEFGVPSTVQIYNLEPALLLALREEGRLPDKAAQPIVDIYSWTTTTLPKGEPAVDLRGMQRLR